MKDRIKAIREYTGTKVSELAKALGVTASYIYGLESGEKTKLSDTLIELFVERFSINRVWLERGTGPVFSTSISIQAEGVSLLDLVVRYIDRIERMLEIITLSPHHDTRRIYHLARLNDGHPLLITGMITLPDKDTPIEVLDVRDALQTRSIPIYQVTVEEHWFAEHILYPRRDKLESLFFLPEVKPLPLAGSQPDSPPAPIASPVTQFASESLVIASAASEADTSHSNARLDTLEASEINIYDLLKKTSEVLESPTIYRTALASNIHAFHQSIIAGRELEAMQSRQTQLEQQVRDLISRVDQLQAERAGPSGAIEHQPAELDRTRTVNGNAPAGLRGPVEPPVEVPIARDKSTSSTGRKHT